MKRTLIALIFLCILSSCEKEEKKLDPPVEALPKLLINEFLASNVACCTDPDGEGEFDDWIEIYNAGEEAVDIGGWYITDKADQLQKFKISTTNPSLTTIQPGGYLVLWADNQPEQGVLHLDFALNVEGEYIGLSTPEGNKVDETTFGAQTPDISSGRIPNGSGEWSTLESPTPGEANQ